MSSNNDNRRTTSRRRAATNGTTNNSEAANNNGARSSRQTVKNYFEDDDNFDPEIIDDTPVSKKNEETNSNRKQNKSNNNENIEKLKSITGLDNTEAAALLEACNNSVENAVEIHFGGGSSDLINSNKNNSSIKQNGLSKSSAANGNGIKSATKRNHNEIDNNDLISVDEDSSSSNSYYGDNVRAPIPPKIDRLVDYDPYAFQLAAQNNKRSRMAYDGFRNMREEFNDGLTNGSKGLSALFRPPIDLLFDGSFETSKIKACSLNKWVMLNVQCQTDFGSNCLNRDIWSDETIKEIIKANFIFFQVYYDSVEGSKLVHIYGINSYPFIAILDPRTGEKLIQYQSNKFDACSFCEKITNFLCENEPDFKQNTESDDIIEILETKNEKEVVVIDEKTETNNGYDSKTYVNGFSSQHKKQNEKPKRALDILNNTNLIEETSDDIYAINYENDEINSKKLNDSYEDDSVISKDKYNKMKQASKLDTQSKIKNETSDSNESDKISQSTSITPTSTTPDENYQPKIIKYQTECFEKKDCFLRILYPNGDRLDFTTNGDSSLKELADYLIKDGFNTKQFELIERLMPNFMEQKSTATTSADANQPPSILSITQQSRNLFNTSFDLTFKQLNLFPRVFLLLQEI